MGNRYRRGIRSMGALFGEPEMIDEQKRKGRDAKLQAEKEECICYRAYYYRVYKGFHIHEVLVEAVARDFWLSTDTVPRIIDANIVLAQQIKKSAPSLEFLREKYPWLAWEGVEKTVV